MSAFTEIGTPGTRIIHLPTGQRGIVVRALSLKDLDAPDLRCDDLRLVVYWGTHDNRRAESEVPLEECIIDPKLAPMTIQP
jgi:hypothetical protein